MAISIVIPAYNGARYLDETIASVCAQTCEDWELIVVDDGSSDETPAIAGEWTLRDRRIRYFRRDNPSGSACPARNAGYVRSNATFPYLLFLDQDDLLKPEALARLRQTLEGNREAVGVHGLTEYIDAGGCRYGQQTLDFRWEWRGKHIVRLALEELTTFYTLATKCCISTPGCVMLRRSALGGELPFPDNDCLALDWDGWLLLTRRGTMVPLLEVVLSYRRTPEGMSRQTQQLHRRMLATRLRVARNPAFTREQREFILKAAGPLEWFHACEKLRYMTSLARAGRLGQSVKQLGYSLRHCQRGLLHSLEARRLFMERIDRTQEHIPSRKSIS